MGCSRLQNNGERGQIMVISFCAENDREDFVWSSKCKEIDRGTSLKEVGVSNWKECYKILTGKEFLLQLV